ncbi:small acid-soluble spore proteins alpha/beta type [Roseburia sp. CAG:303]|nr:small acid-soluble spore proteins alpha/beta type [Roseburia sp. CAG:303]
MAKKNEKKVDLHKLTPEDQLKYEIAEELGLLDKVVKNGWKSLSSKESGKIGGVMASRKKQLRQALTVSDEQINQEWEDF